MRTHNAENERVKRAYFIYLKEARRLSEHSIDAAAAALSRFEEYTKYRDFKSFHIKQAVGFKRKLADRLSQRTGERLSSSTLYATLNALRAFFQWLAGQSGYRSRLTYADADYFALSEKESRIAKATLERFVPTLDQVRRVVRSMPSNTDIELRNRAVVAFTLLTGVRDGAHRLPQAQACGRAEERGHPRRAGGAHQILEDLHDVVLSRGRGHRADRHRLGRHTFERTSTLATAIRSSRRRGWVWMRTTLSSRRLVAIRLVQRHAHPQDLQRGVHRCRAPLR